MATLRDRVLIQILRDGLERGHRDAFPNERSLSQYVKSVFADIMAKRALQDKARHDKRGHDVAARPAAAAATSRVKNHAEVIAEAERLLELRNAVDEAEALSNLQLEGRNETVMDYLALGTANKHFKDVIEKNFIEVFWTHGPTRRTKEGHEVCITRDPASRNKETQEFCVRNILLKVQELILNSILEDSSETTVVKKWVSDNKNVLLDPTHRDHNKILVESRQYLNSKASKDNPRHTAWRNFDPGSPLDSTWAPLFLPPQLGDENRSPYHSGGTETNLAGQRNDCRLRLAYYYLVAVDPNEPKKIADRVNNLIAELYECRRAHNITDPRKQRSNDDPSCYPGTIRRLAQMGKDHTVAVLPNDPMTLLPEIFKDYLRVKLKEGFERCKTYKEKVDLFSALRDFENFDATQKIARNVASYSKELLDIRQRFLNFGHDGYNAVKKFLFDRVINLTLSAQNCRFELNPNNIYHAAKVELLRANIWNFAFDLITQYFWQSLAPDECTNYRRETGEQPPANISISEVISDDPFSDEICKRECEIVKKEAEESGVAILLRSLPSTLKQIEEGYRLKKMVWNIFLKERLDKKKALEVSNELGDSLSGLSEPKEFRDKIEETFSRLPTSFVDSARSINLAQRLLALLNICTVPAPSVPASMVSVVVAIDPRKAAEDKIKAAAQQMKEKKDYEIKSRKELGELPRLVRVGKLSRYRMDLGVGRVAPYPDIDLPRAPVIHPLCPTGLDSTKFRLDGGLVNILVSAQIPSACFTRLPAWVGQICTGNGVSAANLKANIIINNIPWRGESLTFNPQTWLHRDAPLNGPYQNRSAAIMGVTDVHCALLPEQVVTVDNLETRGENGQAVRFFNNKQLAGVENFTESHFIYSICINQRTREAALTLHWLLNDADFRNIKLITEGFCRSHDAARSVNLMDFYPFIQVITPSLSETARMKGIRVLGSLLAMSDLAESPNPKREAEIAHNYRLVNLPSHIVAAVDSAFKKTTDEQLGRALLYQQSMLSQFNRYVNNSSASAIVDCDMGVPAPSRSAPAAATAATAGPVVMAAPIIDITDEDDPWALLVPGGGSSGSSSSSMRVN